MAAWSLITEESGACQTMRSEDGEVWEECTQEEYMEAMRVRYGDDIVDGLKEEVDRLIKVEIR